MITKEINNWLKKVELGAYNDEDVLYELSQIARYLTKDELIMIKNKITNFNQK